MPQYGQFRYGKIAKYGRYKLVTRDAQAIGPYVRYRIRLNTNEYIRMHEERIDGNGGPDARYRLRTNRGEWVYTEQVNLPSSIYKVRVRSVSEGSPSPWVHGESAHLTNL